MIIAGRVRLGWNTAAAELSGAAIDVGVIGIVEGIGREPVDIVRVWDMGTAVIGDPVMTIVKGRVDMIALFVVR